MPKSCDGTPAGRASPALLPAPGLSVGTLPSWIDPGGSIVFGQRLLAQDVIGAFFAHHNRRPVQGFHWGCVGR